MSRESTSARRESMETRRETAGRNSAHAPQNLMALTRQLQLRTRNVPELKDAPLRQQQVLDYVMENDANPMALINVYMKYPSKDTNAKFVGGVREVLIEMLEMVWERIFEDVPTALAKRISVNERSALGAKSPNFTYSEMKFSTLGELLWNSPIKLRPGMVFYDIGSGTGRAVVAAALLHNFRKCVGIEVLHGLHNAAMDVLTHYDHNTYTAMIGEAQSRKPIIHLRRNNVFSENWSDGDVVFINSTCFTEDLMEQLTFQCTKLAPGSYIITATKTLHASSNLKLISSKHYDMAWGLATLHIHEVVGPEAEGGGAGESGEQDGGP